MVHILKIQLPRVCRMGIINKNNKQNTKIELEKWLEEHNIKEMVMKDLEVYLHVYKEEEKEDFN